MDRATKLFVLVWTCAALAAVIYFIRPGWPALPMLAAIAFGGMCVASAMTRRAVGLPLLFTYAFPIIIRLVTAQNYAPYSAIWMAALLGALVPDAIRTGWHVPVRWRAILAAWALTIAVGATIVTFREFDFTTALLYTKRLSNSSIGGWPSADAAWALHVGVLFTIGILWFDWLFGVPRQEVTRVAFVPLAISCAATVAVALYQMFVDVTFLNPTVYGALRRASGLLTDGNVCGTVAALWIGGWLLIRPRSRWGPVVAILGPVACWLAVWASGSRTGLAAALIVTVFVASALWTAARATRSVQSHRLTLTAALAAAAVLIVFVVVPSRAAGPTARIQRLLPVFNQAALSGMVSELWNRDGYGAISVTMIRFAPMLGVGIGGFRFMQPDFSTMSGLVPLAPDNAQNWYRHQLTEFGVLGSVPWILWVGAFGFFVLRRRPDEPLNARIGRGMLLAFAGISFVGMPGQDVSAAFTFWTVAFWFVWIVYEQPARQSIKNRTWLAIVAFVALYGVCTAWQARTTFRVPVRAQRVGWPYSYGFYPPEPDGAGGEQQWTTNHGVIVVDAPTPHLLLTVTPNALAQRQTRDPMRADVIVDREPIIGGNISSTASIVKYVRLPPERRVMIEARVNRTFRPSNVGLNDDRELGLLMRWRFLDRAPTGSDLPGHQP